jgi:HK97 family phage major capsid protein
MRRQMGQPVGRQHREAAERCGYRLSARTLELRLTDRPPRNLFEARAAMSTGANVGGETIPQGFMANFEQALLQFGGIRNAAYIWRTATGNAIPWPTTNDTGNKGELVTEAGTNTEQGVATSAVTFNAYKFGSKLVKVSAELLQDSAFNLAEWLGGVLGERIGRVQADYFTTGTGTDQPKGAATAATLGVTAAAVNAITADELLDLVHSVDPAYRNGASFMLHDQVLLAVRKLKDSTGQYLWQSNIAAGRPDTLHNYPLWPNQSMASVLQASAKTVLFGLLSKYVIREVATIRLRRLVELYAGNDQEGFVAFLRGDGDLIDAGTHPVKYLQQHA